MRPRGLRLVFAVAVFVAAALYVPASHADPVTWATWTTATLGNNRIASGNIGGISVTYTGQIFNFQNGYPQWLPSTSYLGGDVSNAPPLGYLIGIEGGTTQTETITFSKPVVNPVLAIWSLGSAQTLLSLYSTHRSRSRLSPVGQAFSSAAAQSTQAEPARHTESAERKPTA